MTTPLERGYLYALYDILDFNSQLHEIDEDRVWSRLAEKLAVALDIEAATYFTYLPRTRHLIARYALGTASQKLAGEPLDVGTGLAGWVAQHREPLMIEDVYKDKRFLPRIDEMTGFKTRCVLAVPLLERTELTGVLELLNKRSSPFTPEDFHFVEAACRVTALTLRNFRIEARVDKVTAHNASIIENLGGGFLAIDLHGRLILCNPAARSILGLPSDMQLNTPVERSLEQFPQISEILMKTASTRQTVKRQEVACRVGDVEKLIGYSSILIQDPQGNLSGAGIIFQDITANKRR